MPVLRGTGIPAGVGFFRERPLYTSKDTQPSPVCNADAVNRCYSGIMSFATRSVCIVLTVMGSWPAVAQPLRSGRAPHVIIVRLDGLSVDGVNKAPTPRLHDLMARGAWTLEARGVMPTLSSPNWESAIGGAPPE